MDKSESNCQSLSGGSSRRNSDRRRVSFPENELVSYVEPINPLTLAQNVTIQQVKQAYLLSCSKYRTSPIKSILDQISNFKLLEDHRELKLELKDIMLTEDVCETLEELFKRVQFMEIEVAYCTISNNAAAALFEMMFYYDSTTKLKLNIRYGFDHHGWESLGQYLYKNEVLNSFGIFGMELIEPQFKVIIGSLTGNTHLESLKFKDCIFVVPVSMSFLGNKLVQNSILRELHLEHVGLRTEDVEILCSGIKANSSLSLLDLSNNNICDYGADCIFQSLLGKESTSRQLTVLILWNTGLTEKLADPLKRLLKDDYKLELLNIGHNEFKDKGMLAIEEDMSTNKSLARLGFQKCGLTDVGIEVASRIILHNKYLERLDLRGNIISLTGLQAFCNNLQQCDSIVTIDFDKTPLDSSITTSNYATILETINRKCEENRIMKQETVVEERRPLASRKISLTCQTLNTQRVIRSSPMQMSRTSSGRLRSPEVSPLSSPSTSRKPIVTKSRFQISVVAENQNQLKSRFTVISVQDNLHYQKQEQIISNNNNTEKGREKSISSSEEDLKSIEMREEDSKSESADFPTDKPAKMEGIQEIELNISLDEQMEDVKNTNTNNTDVETNAPTKNGIKMLDKISNKENEIDIDDNIEMKIDNSCDSYLDSEDKKIHLDECNLNISVIDQQKNMHEEIMDTSDQL